jgi:hypothetical protein
MGKTSYIAANEAVDARAGYEPASSQTTLDVPRRIADGALR